MDARELEKDDFEPPTISPWRQTPTTAQRRYATDLCRTELPESQRKATFERFPIMSSQEMSALISSLVASRRRRGRRGVAPGSRRR